MDLDVTPVIFGNASYEGGDQAGVSILPCFSFDIWGNRTPLSSRAGRAERFVFRQLIDNPCLTYASELGAFDHYRRDNPQPGSEWVRQLSRELQRYSETRGTSAAMDLSGATRYALRLGRTLAEQLEIKAKRKMSVEREPIDETVRSLKHVLARLRPGDDVFFPSMSFLLTRALGVLFEAEPEFTAKFKWHLLYRRNLVDAGVIDQRAHWAAHSARHSLRFLTSRIRDHKLRVYTDTERLSEEYMKLAGIPCVTVPIPALDAVAVPVKDEVRKSGEAPTMFAIHRANWSVSSILRHARVASRLGGGMVVPLFRERKYAVPASILELLPFLPVLSARHDWPNARRRVQLLLSSGNAAADEALLRSAGKLMRRDDIVVAAPVFTHQLVSKMGAAACFAFESDTEVSGEYAQLAINFDESVSGEVTLVASAQSSAGERRLLTVKVRVVEGTTLLLPMPNDVRKVRLSFGWRGGVVRGSLKCWSTAPEFGRVLTDENQNEAIELFRQYFAWLGPNPTDAENERAREAPVRQPVRITYLGDARAEKGYAHFANLARHFADRHNVRFFAQSNCPENGHHLGTLKDRIMLSRLPYAEVEVRALSPERYAHEISRSDLIWIVYDWRNYFSRSSGIFTEALTAGRTVITTSRSWMGSYLDRFAFRYHDDKFAHSPVVDEAELSRVLITSREVCTYETTLTIGACQPEDEHCLYQFTEPTGYLWITFQTQGEARMPFYVHTAFRNSCMEPIVSETEYFVAEAGTTFSIVRPIPTGSADVWFNLKPENHADQLEIVGLQVRHVLDRKPIARTPGGFKINLNQDVAQQCRDAVQTYLENQDVYRAAAEELSTHFSEYHRASNIARILFANEDWVQLSNRSIAR